MLILPDTSRSVVIPDCTAVQIIEANNTRLNFASGALTLSEPEPSVAASTGSKLLLKIGNRVLPLSAASTVGTLDPRTFVFTIDMPPPPKSYITLEVKLPQDIDTVNAEAALSFESLLAAHSFLLTSLTADADDAARTLRESANSVAKKISEYTDWRVQRSMEVEDEVSDATKARVEKAVQGSASAAAKTGRASEAVAGVAESTGEWVVVNVGGLGAGDRKDEGERGFVAESVHQGLGAVGALGRGLADAVGTVRQEVGEGMARVVESEKGPEARAVVDGVRDTSGNVGSIAKDVLLGTSAAWHAGEAGVAAAREGTK